MADLFADAGLRPVRVTITAGGEVKGRGNRLARGQDRSDLDAGRRLHTGELRFAAKLGRVAAMREELKISAAMSERPGRTAYEARQGSTTDLVFGCAIFLFRRTATAAPMAASASTALHRSNQTKKRKNFIE